MNQEEISQGNKLIAKFMGAKYEMQHHIRKEELWLPIHGIVRYDTIEIGKGKILHYHNSWDWLMPVVERIHKMGKLVSINFYSENDNPVECKIYNWGVGDPEIETETLSAIESVWSAVVEFIKWYQAHA